VPGADTRKGKRCQRRGVTPSASYHPSLTTSPRVSWRTTDVRRRWAAAASSAAVSADAAEAVEVEGVVAWRQREREREQTCVRLRRARSCHAQCGKSARSAGVAHTGQSVGWTAAGALASLSPIERRRGRGRRRKKHSAPLSHLLFAAAPPPPPPSPLHIHDRQALGDEKVAGMAGADGDSLAGTSQAVDRHRQADGDAGGGGADGVGERGRDATGGGGGGRRPGARQEAGGGGPHWRGRREMRNKKLRVDRQTAKSATNGKP